MATKELKTRIALKYDSYANWTDDKLGDNKGANLVLLKGEIGICEIPANFEANGDSRVMPTVLFKVGDGTKKFSELPWASAKAADVYGWAKASDVVLEGKTIKFVGTDKTVVLDYVTETEVNNLIKAITDGLTTRVGNLETNKLDASVFTEWKSGFDTDKTEHDRDHAKKQTEITADIATAKSEAIEEAGNKDTALHTVISKEIDDDIKAAIDAEVARANAAYDATGSAATAEQKAKDYADGLAGNYDAAGSADAAQAAAEAKAAELDEALHTIISAEIDADVKAATDALDEHIEAADLRITNLASAHTLMNSSINSINTILGGWTVAEPSVKEAVTTLTTNTTNHGTRLTNAETRLSDLESINSADRLDRIEAFFESATEDVYGEDGEKLTNALDTLVEIQEYITGDGKAASDMLDAIAANSEAIDNVADRATALENITSGFAGTEGEASGAIKNAIDAVSVRAELGITNAAAAQAAAEAAQGDATQALADAATAQGDATQALADAATAQTTAEAAQTYAEGVASDLAGEVARATKAETDNLAEAKKYTDDEVAKVTAESLGLGNVENKSTATIKSEFTGAVAENDNGFVTGDAVNTAIAGAIAAADIEDKIAEALQAAKDYADENDANTVYDDTALAGRVKAIEDDYVKASDLIGDVYIFDCGSSTEVIH